MDVGELAAHGVEDGLGGAGVPLLAAGAGEHVRVRLALDQQHHLKHTTWMGGKAEFSQLGDGFISGKNEISCVR